MGSRVCCCCRRKENAEDRQPILEKTGDNGDEAGEGGFGSIDKVKEALQDQEQEYEDSYHRKYELVLVFDKGLNSKKGDDVWRMPTDERNRSRFDYLDERELGIEGIGVGAENQTNAASMVKKLSMNKAEGFRRVINATRLALKRNGFLVKVHDDFKDDLRKDTDPYYFLLIGLTDLEMRKWADHIRFQLELEPLLLVNWLQLMNDPLGKAVADADDKSPVYNEAAGDSSDKRRLLTDDIWFKLYAPFFKNSPPDIYKQRRSVWSEDPTLGDTSIFKTADRIKLIMDKLERSIKEGGCEMHLRDLKFLDAHPLIDFFCLHYEPERDRIARDVNRSCLCTLPVSDIAHYYGEYIGIYFAYLEYYTKSLFIPSLIGIVVFGLQCKYSIDSPASAIMAMAMIVWARMFVSFWKRQEHVLVCYWGQKSFANQQRIRPQFRGDWVYSEVDGTLMPYVDPSETCLQLTKSWSITICCLLVLMANSIGMIFARGPLADRIGAENAATTIGVVTAIEIIIFDAIYSIVADYTNDIENHMTASEYENALVLKSFLFRAINAYNSFFYVAFFKQYVDGCTDDEAVGCLEELRYSLGTVFATVLIYQNCAEYFTLKCADQLNHSFQAAWVDQRGQIFDEWKKVEYDSTFEDFNELVIQFGYISLFVVALPLMPLMALMNCFVESRIDMAKLASLTKRPIPQGSNSIGTWIYILDTMSWICCATNIAIVCFITNDMTLLTGLEGDDETKLLMFVMIEHLIIAIVFWSAQNDKDPPPKILEHYDRQAHIASSLERYASTVHEAYSSWEDWTATELSHYLKILGGEKRQGAAEGFRSAQIDGKASKRFTNFQDLLPIVSQKHKESKANKEDAKWCFAMIQDLKKASEREAGMLSKLVKIAEQADEMRNNVIKPYEPVAQQQRKKLRRLEQRSSRTSKSKFNISIFEFGVFVGSLSGNVRERVFDQFGQNVEDTDKIGIPTRDLEKMLNLLVRIFWSTLDKDPEELKGHLKDEFEDAIDLMSRRIHDEWIKSDHTHLGYFFKFDLSLIGEILRDQGVEIDEDALEDSASMIVPEFPIKEDLMDLDVESESDVQLEDSDAQRDYFAKKMEQEDILSEDYSIKSNLKKGLQQQTRRRGNASAKRIRFADIEDD